MKNFQRKNDLAVDGVMKPGGPTQSILGRRLSGRGNERDLVPKAFAPLGGLGKGERNREKDVLGLRRGLAGLGLMPEAEAVSGKTLFDTPLERAVKALQGKHGLKEDGVIRPQGPTLEALVKRLKDRTAEGDDDDPKRKPKPPPKPTPKPTPPQDPDRPGPDDPDKPDPDDPDKPKPDEPKEPNEAECRRLTVAIGNGELNIESVKEEVASYRKQLDEAYKELTAAQLNLMTLGISEIDFRKPTSALFKIAKKVSPWATLYQLDQASARLREANRLVGVVKGLLSDAEKRLVDLENQLRALKEEFARKCG